MEARQLRQHMREVRKRFRLSATAQALYEELVWLFEENGCPEDLRIENKVLYMAIHISENTLKRVREELMSAKLLIYISEKAKKLFGVYSIPGMICTSNSAVQSAKRIAYTSNFEVQTSLSTSNFEVENNNNGNSTSKFEVENSSNGVCTSNSAVESAKGFVCTSKFADNTVYSSTNTVDNISSSKEELVKSSLLTTASPKKGKRNVSGKPAAESDADDADIPAFSTVGRDMRSLVDYLTNFRPKAPEPYFVLWNLFAAKYGLPTLQKLTASRKGKIRARLTESDFDFVKILTAGSKSPFLLERKVLTFDWIVVNEKNYLKVLEGNYFHTPQKQKSNESISETAAQTAAIDRALQQRQSA